MSDDGSESLMDDDAAAAPSDPGTAATTNQRSSVDSSIISVTADFSMQNVLLQVGSRLLVKLVVY
jgi:rRNA maturation endonuclease Nob1